MLPFFWPLAVLSVVLGADPIAVGTDRLGRSLTDEERKRLGARLREHDYAGAYLIALRFAFKLRRTPTGAQDLMGRMALRLVRHGWDPQEVTLTRRLCRLVWSEWTNEASETQKARKAEETFVKELEETEGLVVPSVETRVSHLEARREEQSHAETQLAKLRAAFEIAGDAVNLLWLDFTLAGETDVGKMAERSQRDVSELYAAAKRRKRTVRRLLGAARDVPYGEED